MATELKPISAAGARLVAAAGAAAAIADDAGAVDALRRAGYLRAPVPVALGGLGVSSVQDLAAAQSRLARTHSSLAEAVAIHFAAVVAMAQRHEAALAGGTARRAGQCARLLERVAREGMLLTYAGETDVVESAVVAFLRAAAAVGAVESAASVCVQRPALARDAEPAAAAVVSAAASLSS